MQDYETRKHFEAAVDDLATLHGVTRDSIREEFKDFLVSEFIIKSSTTELSDYQLKALADKISIFRARMENTPPDERGILNTETFKNILRITLNPK